MFLQTQHPGPTARFSFLAVGVRVCVFVFVFVPVLVPERPAGHAQRLFVLCTGFMLPARPEKSGRVPFTSDTNKPDICYETAPLQGWRRLFVFESHVVRESVY